ncbi:ComEA family DNA-binding protein [Nitritalea halalkaliphila]|nr:helix-hairpin-helix domain-containing protein [Nitritalea halalkaliphila]
MRNTLFKLFQNYFSFTRRETRGILLIVPFLILLNLIPQGIKWAQARKLQHELIAYEGLLDSLETLGFQRIPKEQMWLPADSIPKKKKWLTQLSILEADSINLQIVPGVGEKTAARIAIFLEQLGGLHDFSQLTEVFGVDEALVMKIEEYFFFEEGALKKIPINRLEAAELADHPYISYGLAKVLVAYRNQHGPYTQLRDLQGIKIIDPEWITLIQAYLDFSL